jgi:hypothetical protein
MLAVRRRQAQQIVQRELGAIGLPRPSSHAPSNTPRSDAQVGQPSDTLRAHVPMRDQHPAGRHRFGGAVAPDSAGVRRSRFASATTMRPPPESAGSTSTSATSPDTGLRGQRAVAIAAAASDPKKNRGAAFSSFTEFSADCYTQNTRHRTGIAL